MVMAGELATALLLTLLAAATAGPEADALLAFRLRGPQNGPPAPLSQWETTPEPCVGGNSQWYGVKCHEDKDSVLVQQLEYLGLQGPAPDLSLLAPLKSTSNADEANRQVDYGSVFSNVAGALTGLLSLSLTHNNLTGTFPDVSGLPALKMLYLSGNRLAGVIPAFTPLQGLQKLLFDNAFTGPIPSSITSPGLLELQLSENGFEGPLLDFGQKNLTLVDFSYNNLSGPIPLGLRRFDANAFQGNSGLCGPPLNVSCAPPPSHRR